MKVFLSLAAALLLLTAAACSPKSAEPQRVTVLAMSTLVDITAYNTDPSEAVGLVDHYDRLLSVTDPDSDVSKINESGGAAVEVSAETMCLLKLSLGISLRTGGALDVTVYPVVKAWGFTGERYRVVPHDELEKLLRLVDYRGVLLDEAANTVTLTGGADAEIDLGAVAKGYVGDRIIENLRQSGETSAIINLGGNVQTLGTKPDGTPWRVAVRDPFEPETYLGTVSIGEGAVITSGSYERFFPGEDGKRYHHIIDPSTGYPADNGLASVTVVVTDGTPDAGFRGDALSTALFVLGADAALEYWSDNRDFELILVAENGEVIITQGLADNFKLSDGKDYTLSMYESGLS